MQGEKQGGGGCLQKTPQIVSSAHDRLMTAKRSHAAGANDRRIDALRDRRSKPGGASGLKFDPI